MHTVLFIIYLICCGLFGWWIADFTFVDQAFKELTGKKNPDNYLASRIRSWKAWTLEGLFCLALLLCGTLSYISHKTKTYDTNEYKVEYVIDKAGQIDSTSFKIVKCKE